MANEAEKILNNFLKQLQKSELIRTMLAAFILIILSGVAGYFIYEVLPRQYSQQSPLFSQGPARGNCSKWYCARNKTDLRITRSNGTGIAGRIGFCFYSRRARFNLSQYCSCGHSRS